MRQGRAAGDACDFRSEIRRIICEAARPYPAGKYDSASNAESVIASRAGGWRPRAKQIGQAREDAAGFEAADVLRHRFGGNVEQRVAGEVAAFGRQILDGIGDQLHGALQVGDAIGLALN